jgi:hypothetical protein
MSLIRLLPDWGEQLPVPLGDDLDGAVDDFDGADYGAWSCW